ncbi:MAG: RluA family pseudouridine synthase [Pseudomonadota bacterium]
MHADPLAAPPPPPPPYTPPPDEGPAVLAADDAFLAVDKPAGLLTVPGRGAHLQDCLLHRVQARYPLARLVHRLDQPTSGIVVFGLGPGAQRALAGAFERRQVDKRYVALVAGRLASAEGEIDLPLACDWPNRPRHVVDRLQGRPAQTRWRVLGFDERLQATRVELQPLTGRTHQLRVHLQALGHPILGDGLYAAPVAQAAAPRLMLHATRLVLPHPADGSACVLESPSPF